MGREIGPNEIFPYFSLRYNWFAAGATRRDNWLGFGSVAPRKWEQFTVFTSARRHNPLGIVTYFFSTGTMAGRNFKLAVAVGALLLAGSVIRPATAAQLYRWVDESGEVHYSDRVPPEEVKLDREVLNKYGVTVKVLSHELSQQELVVFQRQRAIEAAEQKRIRDANQRDMVLLNTYLSIDEIEALRNRRKELLDGQIRVTEVYLKNLGTKLTKLQKDASRFQPYNPDPNAPPINARLAKELSNTLNSILVYEQTLVDTRKKQTQLVAKFSSDIDRYRHLRSLN
jgi:hypothetical protein